MPVPDPKKDQSMQSGGGAQKSAHPLERYTVAPKNPAGDSQDDKSPYYKSAAPTISLPKGGGALKGIDEKFTVNAVNGTASLQVQFPLSPGRGGFTPSLSLQYNSGSGNSEFGQGWGMSLPAIQRKTDRKLPQYDDANDGDVFVMAGAEDLVPLSNYNEFTSSWVPEFGGHIGGSMETYVVKAYRPRIEGLFAKIEFVYKYGSPGTWWKVTTKDNVVTFYGLTAAGRLSDPQDPNRVFKWLPEVSYDNKGNVQVYTYFTEDTFADIPPALHEANRANGLAPFTNVYLKSVKYCNLTPYTVSSPYFFDVSTVMPSSSDFLMEAVLDYGDHDIAEPTPTPSGEMPARMDPFSDFHAGFEIRTYRKCSRVLMFHYFDELDGGDPVLVRSLDLTYNTEVSPPVYTETSRIVSVTQKGYILESGSYISKSLPAMTFDYAPLEWNSEIQSVSPEDTVHAPQGLTGNYQWIDLWGEGLPGILTEQGNGWFYKRNLGDGHFTHAIPVAEKPSLQGLGKNMQWQDLDANGRRQLVSRDRSLPGYYELDDDQRWEPFRTFKQWATIDWESPFTRVLDLNGDGRPDVLITEDSAWRWYENEGTDGYSNGGYGAVFADEEKGPRLLLNDMIQAIFLADMNGDGMTDIVRIQNGEVCYWPNMGYGRFGAKVSMTNAPLFDDADHFNPIYLTLSDISGTGAADIIYIGRGKCTAWVNMAGNAFGDAHEIGVLPGMEQFSKVTVADFLGTGTSCIVWSSPLPQYTNAPMRYIDLMGGNKPHLMMGYSNGMGKTVELTYKQSTRYYLDDMAALTPWATMLPFPVHCISRVETSDSVSETSYAQLYSYHHGYYDHEEREFRGFGRVDVTDTETAVAYDQASPPNADNLDQAPVLTKTWYHTGAWMRKGTLTDAFALEYYTNTLPQLPTNADLLTAVSGATLNAQEQREAYRALKGQPLRQEVYALDGSADEDKPYTITSHHYAVQQVQPLLKNRFASFRSYQQQALTISCERNIADPRIMHDLTLSTDKYGNVLENAKAVYERQITPSPVLPTEVSDAQAKKFITYTSNTFTNDCLSGCYMLRLAAEAKTYEVTGITPAGALWGVAELRTAISGATAIAFTDAPGSGAKKRLLSHSRITYLDINNDELDLTVLDKINIPYRQYALAITSTMLSGSAWYDGKVTGTMLGEGGYLREDGIASFSSSDTTRYWLPGGTANYDLDHFWTPTLFTDPWGNNTALTYWNAGGTNYYLLPESTTDAVGNVMTVNAYNWYNLQPTHITDINDNESHILYDALGMPVAVAVNEKDGSTTGNTLSGIDPHADAVAQADFFDNPLAEASGLLQGASWRCVYDLSASPVVVGMIAREKHNAEDPASPTLIKLTYTDGLGRIAMHKVQAAPDPSTADERWTGSGKTVYNNKGMTVMQFEPYYSPTHVYDTALQAELKGVSPRMHYDPLGRLVRTDMPDGSYTKTEWDNWTQIVWDNNDTVLDSDWYAARTGSGALAGNADEVDAKNKAANHESTPATMYLDTLARPFYTIQYDRLPDTATPPVWNDNRLYESYVDLDIQGNRLTIHDALGRTSLTYSYNMLNAVVQQNSIDSGTNIMMTDAANQPLYAWDTEGRKNRVTYDQLRRLSTREATWGSPEVTRVVQQMVYGESVSGSASYNLNGKLYEQYDCGGYKIIQLYSINGEPIRMRRRLLVDYTIGEVDWSTGPALDFGYRMQNSYDALGRLVSVIDPEINEKLYEYDRGGMLFAISFRPSTGLLTAYYVLGIYYTAHGQREVVAYGNFTSAKYTYDPYTHRVKRIFTTDNTNTFQDLNYWYDPVGNITRVQDDAQRALYFDNQVTLPRTDYTYDALYRLIKANGREQIGTATFGSDDNYNDNPWMGISHPGDDTVTQNYMQKYAYDAVGNIQTLQHIAGTGSYTRTFNYVSGTNYLDNTVIGSNTYSVTHDARGNIESMPHLHKVLYNEDNLMMYADNASSTTETFYQYSGGERVRMVEAPTAGFGYKERIYLGDYEIYREYTGATLTLQRSTVHISDDTGRIAMIETRIAGLDPGPATLSRYIYSNHIGTATLELDNACDIISYEEYHPYGTTAYQASNAAINATAKRYRYVGKERDELTGFYYMGARYYAAWLTRWTACDPINTEWYNHQHGNPGRSTERQFVEFTASSYEYCYANPVRFTDPTGEQVPFSVWVDIIQWYVTPSKPPTIQEFSQSPGKMAMAIGKVGFGALNKAMGTLGNMAAGTSTTHAPGNPPNKNGFKPLPSSSTKFSDEEILAGGGRQAMIKDATQHNAMQATVVTTMAAQGLVELGIAARSASLGPVFSESAETIGATTNTATKTFLRGTSRTAELEVQAETDYIMSDAAIEGYKESTALTAEGKMADALKASQVAHEKHLEFWGSLDDYMQAHATFPANDMAEIAPRSMISVTDAQGTAENFANGGQIFRFDLNPNAALPQTLPGAGESEYLIFHMFKVGNQ